MFRWDPSRSCYTIQATHHYVCNISYPMPSWHHWKVVWKSEAIPKIKFFLWILLNGKTLTAENLQKRGINGPSRCPNCLAAEELMHHLFIECHFAINCWRNLSHNNQIPWNTQNTIGEILYKWKKDYPWQHRKNNIVKRV